MFASTAKSFLLYDPEFSVYLMKKARMVQQNGAMMPIRMAMQP